MLTKIVLTNFKSFKNRTEVDFTKTNYAILPQNVHANGVLKGNIFVGANASGKSNLLLAIKLLLDFLFKEREINSGLFLCLFGSEPRFSLEYHFLIDQVELVYLLEVEPRASFIHEMLTCNGKNLMERMGLGAQSFITDPHGVSHDDKDVPEDSLFLRTLYFNTKFSNNSTLIKWMPGFRELKKTSLIKWMDFLEHSVYINPFEGLMISYGKDKMNLESYLKQDGCEKINHFFDAFGFNQRVDYSHTATGSGYRLVAGSNDEDRYIYFRRRGIEQPIPFSEESCGNKNLLRMLPAFLTVSLHGGLLLIDEFSSGFHNELEELLVKYFMRVSENGQMLFVSHSTNLLSNSILRPDQAYAVEFRGKDGSFVNRFSNQQPRAAQNIEKMYNSGVFGGLPNYEEPFHET